MSRPLIRRTRLVAILSLLIPLCLLGSGFSPQDAYAWGWGKKKPDNAFNPTEQARQAADPLAPVGSSLELSPPPPVLQQSQPIAPSTSTKVPARADSPKPDPADPVKFKSYNTTSRELDLWNLEERRFVRSPIVVSPDKSTFAYSEVIFSPHNRQTVSRVYRVPIEQAAKTDNIQRLPSETVAMEDDSAPPPDAQWYEDRLNPDKTLQRREAIVQVGYDKSEPYDFKTLTIVDWSPNGHRLLMKQKNGTFHVGLRTSNILVYDQETGTTTIYPELRRIISHYWREHGNMPNLGRMNWEMYPVGWEPGSDSAIVIKAWALDTTQKKFLGVWRYNVDSQSASNMVTENETSVVSTNGWVKIDIPKPPPKEPVVRAKKTRVEAKVLIKGVN